MDRIRIVGGKPLQGVLPIGGAKNAALPLLAVTAAAARMRLALLPPSHGGAATLTLTAIR